MMDNLKVTIDADTDDFVDDIDDAREAVEDLAMALQRLDETLDQLNGRDITVEINNDALRPNDSDNEP